MEYYIDAKIDQNDYPEAIESMSADVFLNRDNDNWTVKIGTHINDKHIELFERSDCKHKGIANSVMDGAWNKLKKKFNTNVNSIKLYK